VCVCVCAEMGQKLWMSVLVLALAVASSLQFAVIGEPATAAEAAYRDNEVTADTARGNRDPPRRRTGQQSVLYYLSAARRNVVLITRALLLLRHNNIIVCCTTKPMSPARTTHR